jgi:hypothetical protein
MKGLGNEKKDDTEATAIELMSPHSISKTKKQNYDSLCNSLFHQLPIDNKGT